MQIFYRPPTPKEKAAREAEYEKMTEKAKIGGSLSMAQIIIEIRDDLAKYLQTHAEERGMLLSAVLTEMIDQNLSMSDDIEEAIRISGMAVRDSARPVVDAMAIVMSGLHYHKENVHLLERDALALCTLRKIDARKGDKTRDAFLSDLMDRLEEVA